MDLNQATIDPKQETLNKPLFDRETRSTRRPPTLGKGRALPAEHSRLINLETI